MTAEERFDRIERILDRMAARQGYHDEALERHDAQMKEIREALAIDAENIRRLANIASAHETRLQSHEERIEDLEEGHS